MPDTYNIPFACLNCGARLEKTFCLPKFPSHISVRCDFDCPRCGAVTDRTFKTVADMMNAATPIIDPAERIMHA